jgi:hypothetical protein
MSKYSEQTSSGCGVFYCEQYTASPYNLSNIGREFGGKENIAI